MKIVVTGSLGNISKPLTSKLTAAGNHVIVISRSEKRKSEIENMGAEAAFGSIENVEFLTDSFKGSDAVYLMIPPHFKEFNSNAYYQRIARNYKEAIANSGVQSLVFLSSWGAHLDSGTGTILGAHYAEIILNELRKINITYIRPTSFYYNLYHYIEMIKQAGIIGTNFKSDDKIAWAHPEDISQAISEELTTAHKQTLKIRYVSSDEATPWEVAKSIGKAIGKPELEWMTLSDEQVKESLIGRGLPEDFAQELVDLNASISSGRMGGHYEKHKPEFGKVKLEDFAQEFAEQYKCTK